MLMVLCQACVVPMDPYAVKVDVCSALEQLNPHVVVCFRGMDTVGLTDAAADMPNFVGFSWCVIEPSGLYKAEISLNGVSLDDDAIPMEHGFLSVTCRVNDHSERDALRGLDNPAHGVGMVLRTSGTTSKPKIVPLSAGALASNGVAQCEALNLKAGDCCLNAMPLFHIGGLNASILATVAAGASVTCMSRFDAQSFLDHLLEGKPQPTWYSGVPTISFVVLNHAVATHEGMLPSHKLRFIRTGAAALSPFDAMRLMKFWGVPVIPTYSMTEQMPITGSPMDAGEECLDTVGKPLCCSMALVDQDKLHPVMFGSKGEVCISGPNVATEYQDNADANRKSYFYVGSSCFFRTGDIGTIDTKGYLRLVGRAKELIKRGGEQVSPVEVEAILVEHADVKTAIVFAVPSTAWGEEVGAALILHDDASRRFAPDVIVEVRRFALDTLASMKVPAYWRVVTDSELPKTATGKYIRANLAQHLGVEGKDDVAPMPMQRPPIVSSSLSGLRYIMGVGVMFNHIASTTEGEYSLGNVFGKFKSSTFYFPATVFFVLGGYSLSAGLSARPVANFKKFYLSRAATMHPQYLFAMLLAVIFVLSTCSEYSEKFTFQRGESFRSRSEQEQCQSGAVVMPYGASIVTSILVFGLGLQAWPFLNVLSHWLLFYSWFSSVYYFIILVFPPLHNMMSRVRGNKRKLWIWFGVSCLLVYLTCVTLVVFYLLPKWTTAQNNDEAGGWTHNLQNFYGLSTILFPPYWIPSALIGMAAYFLYDAHRPYESHKCWIYGWICDLLSLAFIAFHIGMAIDYNWPYPDAVNDIDGNMGADQNSGIERYMWSVMVSWFMVPLIALWIMFLSMPGKSFTARLFEMPLFVDVLGPTAYGCFLYHQIVAQWYFLATRGEIWDWWSYRKSYYWFSPKPMPGAWYEFPYVVMLVTFWSMFVNAYIQPYLMIAWKGMIHLIARLTGNDGVDAGDLTALELINEALVELTGGTLDVDESTTWEQVGLGSIGLPAMVNAFESVDDGLHLAVGDLVHLENVGELCTLINDRRRNATQNAGVGFEG